MEYDIPVISYSIVGFLGKKNSEKDLWEQLQIFPAGFPIDIAYGNPAGKVANGDHVTTASL